MTDDNLAPTAAGDGRHLDPKLHLDFPIQVITESWGEWWRIHRDGFGPWWFESADRTGREQADVGRFDLPLPDGTCYLGANSGGTVSEVLRERGVAAADAQQAAGTRLLSQMPLNDYYGLVVADFTAPALERYGAPADIGLLTRAQARPWALATKLAGWDGILFRLHEDPERRCGLALFYAAGERPSPSQQVPGTKLTVGMQHELRDLFGGEWSGDPLAS